MDNLKDILAKHNIMLKDDYIIKGISDDHHDIIDGFVYIAFNKSLSYVKEIIDLDIIVLSEYKIENEKCIYIANLKVLIDDILFDYYGDLSSKLMLIGVSGTNGKTSISSYLHSCLDNSMLIGTNGVFYKSRYIKINNTTPSKCKLHYLLNIALKNEITTIIMEISSHAIDLNRIYNIYYDYICISNITKDHLDYHKTYTHYIFTKYKLRWKLKKEGKLVINVDDKNLFGLLNYTKKVITLGKCAHYSISNISNNDDSYSFRLNDEYYTSSLKGDFNIYNLSFVIIILKLLGYKYKEIISLTSFLHEPTGRMEVIETDKLKLIIDFAHTPDGLLKLLEYANSIKVNNVILVIGCGGERDRNKRKYMGQIGSSYSDILILTQDNSRNEDINIIINDIEENIEKDHYVIHDRKKAIQFAINIAKNNDIIVIGGRGNEDYLDIKNVKIFLNDKQYVLELLDQEDIRCLKEC